MKLLRILTKNNLQQSLYTNENNARQILAVLPFVHVSSSNDFIKESKNLFSYKIAILDDGEQKTIKA